MQAREGHFCADLCRLAPCLSNFSTRFRRAMFCFRWRLNLDLSPFRADMVISSHQGGSIKGRTAALRWRGLSGPRHRTSALNGADVLCLPALGSFFHIKLDLLTFLQTPESTSLNCREVHENVLAVLPANKAKPLGVVEPLYCSCFHILSVPFEEIYAGRRSEVLKAGASWLARLLNNRF